MRKKQQNSRLLHFPTVSLAKAVSNRKSKHLKVLTDIFSDLKRLSRNSALRIDLEAMGKKRADLRSAVHREARKRGVEVLTTSDEKHLYVFRRIPEAAKGNEVRRISNSAGRQA